MRRSLLAVGAAAALAAFAALPASAAAPADAGAFTLAVYGDAPYGTTPTDDAEFKATPSFINSINSDPAVSVAVHVGDIHSGKQYCTAQYDQSIATLWQQFQVPLVYTPGDNEWTDCHKAAEGGGTYDPATDKIKYVIDPATGQPVDYAGGDPVANLALVRSLFFPTAGETLGSGKLHVQSQAKEYDPAHPSDAQYVENVIFERKGTLFVTLNVPGGSNNDADVWYGAPTASSAQTQETAERTGADLRWLDHAFTQARQNGDTSIAIISQADMWDVDGKSPAHLTNYEPLVASIASHTTAFGKPVLMFNGDSHTYRSDNPLSPTAPCVTESAAGEVACANESSAHPGYDVANFHRIVVHGSTFPLEWLRLTVKPSVNAPASANAFGPFSWQRMPQH
ncbi:conserved exported hypothetical protein [Frankia canadensis]|uniref:Calcineurin-like phosphoesterase domain-containing protein n=1 Tax=Frankia canadensis TaxID=1836972 RepID=A0A2I2L1P9_9ACTN|nr:hypothetical protein [Frankia canadensis]SNQ51856.1 conserved exported hypothetical protein [Frankia canadensis]SOU59146.1 conserved exported hypothetical protein [Frankia canadensis]